MRSNTLNFMALQIRVGAEQPPLCRLLLAALAPAAWLDVLDARAVQVELDEGLGREGPEGRRRKVKVGASDHCARTGDEV